MLDSIKQLFQPWSAHYEGNALPFPYADVLGLVTTGTGNLIDPVSAMLALPWRISSHGNSNAAAEESDPLAPQSDVIAAFNAVKANLIPGVVNGKSLANGGRGGGGFYPYTTVRLSKSGLDQLVNSKLQANDNQLHEYFPDAGSWPADAQLALHSFAWAAGLGHVGPSGDFKMLRAALLKKDFNAAAEQVKLAGYGVDERNAANKQMLQNAAAVVSKGLDTSIIQWPLTSAQILSGMSAGANDAYNYAVGRLKKGFTYAASKPVAKAVAVGAAVYVGLGLAVLGGTIAYRRMKK